jgi:hypothetical protein
MTKSVSATQVTECDSDEFDVGCGIREAVHSSDCRKCKIDLSGTKDDHQGFYKLIVKKVGLLFSFLT